MLLRERITYFLPPTISPAKSCSMCGMKVKNDHRSKFSAVQYEFHIYFTSFHCTGRYELNKLTSLPMCGFTAHLVEHRIGIAEVTGSNPVEALLFFRVLPSNCFNWKIYCGDHSSLSSSTAVQYEFRMRGMFHIWYESRLSKICACATATGHRTKNNLRFCLRKDKEKNVAFEPIRQVLFFHFS